MKNSGPENYDKSARKDLVDYRIEQQNMENGITRENPALGLFLYKNVFSKKESQDLITEMENILDDPDSPFRFHNATMNYNEEIPSVRKCDMFRFGENIDTSKKNGLRLKEIHSEIIKRLKICLDDYCSEWNMSMDFIQRINFLRYHEGEYFKIHVDDGPMNSYIVTSLLYLNDDFTGGEILYNRFNYKLKPEVGSILIAPANYIYEHESLPVISGKKYAMTMMCDYNDFNHR